MAKAKRKLSNFNVTGIAVTEESQGGACSLLNDPILLKSLKEGAELSDNQKSLLTELGHDISSLGKSLAGEEENPQGASSSEKPGEDPKDVNKTQGEEDEMSAELVKQLQHEVAVMKVEKSLSPYSFDEETSLAVASAVAKADEEGVEAILKAFDFLVACGEYGVAVAQASEVSKSKGEENPLKKMLEEEAGSDAVVNEEPVEKTLKEQVADALAAEYQKGAK